MASQKGSNFEREMARAISLWWTKGVHDDCLWRVLGSGGMATRKERSGKSTTHASFNDIEPKTADAHAFTDHVICELKRGYKGWSITDVLDSKNPKKQKWAEFFDQTTYAWKASKRAWWLVIFKRDQRKIMVALCPDLWLKIKGFVPGTPRAIFLDTGYDCVLITWEQFVKIDPDFFRGYAALVTNKGRIHPRILVADEL